MSKTELLMAPMSTTNSSMPTAKPYRAIWHKSVGIFSGLQIVFGVIPSGFMAL